jgi:hypothetical protein
MTTPDAVNGSYHFKVVVRPTIYLGATTIESEFQWKIGTLSGGLLRIEFSSLCSPTTNCRYHLGPRRLLIDF